MTSEQAEELLSYIQIERRKPDSAHVYQLGNGEHVCILTKPTQWFCWGFADWQAFRQAEEEKHLQAKKHLVGATV